MRRTRPEQLRGLYLQMCRMRHLELAVTRLWEQGLVSGELHLGIGEEAVVAGVMANLRDGDALALDYRCTPPLVARGVDLDALLLELVGSPDGLCRGYAGHMHLMSQQHLAAASGIVGAPGPLACGFGLAARTRGRSDVVVAFFGDGAVNEGMLMESLNLASVWRLPVVFVCKDNRWAITSRPASLTGGGLRRRAQGLGLPVTRVDGSDPLAVSRAARGAVERARTGRGPTFLVARCRRPQGHFVGDPVGRVLGAAGAMAGELRTMAGAASAQPGAPFGARARAVGSILRLMARATVEGRSTRTDPLRRTAGRLPREVATEHDRRAADEVEAAVRRTLESLGVVADAS